MAIKIYGELVEKVSTKTQKPYKVFECVVELPDGQKFSTKFFPSPYDWAIIRALSNNKGGVK